MPIFVRQKHVNNALNSMNNKNEFSVVTSLLRAFEEKKKA